MADDGGDGAAGGGALGGAVFIKRVKKVEGGAHGGAWKIAYADFVTAMMAFFLLLWLLNSVTQEQLEGISNYFAPASVSESTSGAGGILGGQTMSEEGAEISSRAKPTVTLDLPPPKTGLGGESQADAPSEPSEKEDATKEQLKKAEEKQFDEAKKELEKALAESNVSEELKKSLLVDNTVEGLRIQIVDQEGLPLFHSGSSAPLPRAVELLKLVKIVIDKLSQKISISGHTDAVRFGSGGDYTNWELSVDRANSARRILHDLGLDEIRLSRVVGKSSTELLIKDNPKDPQNRRLSIVMLRGTGDRPDVGPDSSPDAILRNREDADKIGNAPLPSTPPAKPSISDAIPPTTPDNGANPQLPENDKGGALPLPAPTENKNTGGLRGLILRR